MSRPPEAIFGLSAMYIAKACAVDLSTARKWKSGARVPPKTAVMILARDLGCFAAEWAGWSLNGDNLVPPFGSWTINRNDALAVPLMFGQISALRADLAAIKASRDELEEQPEPGELPAIYVS